MAQAAKAHRRGGARYIVGSSSVAQAAKAHRRYGAWYNVRSSSVAQAAKAHRRGGAWYNVWSSSVIETRICCDLGYKGEKSWRSMSLSDLSHR